MGLFFSHTFIYEKEQKTYMECDNVKQEEMEAKYLEKYDYKLSKQPNIRANKTIKILKAYPYPILDDDFIYHHKQKMVVVELEMGSRYYRGASLSINTEIVGYPGTYEHFEEVMREQIDQDDEYWKMAVADGRTTLSLEEFNEDIINMEDPIDFLDLQDYGTRVQDEDYLWDFECLGCLREHLSCISKGELDEVLKLKDKMDLKSIMKARRLLQKLGDTVEEDSSAICKEILLRNGEIYE